MYGGVAGQGWPATQPRVLHPQADHPVQVHCYWTVRLQESVRSEACVRRSASKVVSRELDSILDVVLFQNDDVSKQKSVDVDVSNVIHDIAHQNKKSFKTGIH